MKTKYITQLWIIAIAAITLLTLSTVPGNAATLYDDAVSYWKFDDGSGSTAADSKGSNFGTLNNGPTWATGRIGGALSFDGTNDFVRINTAATLPSTSFSISTWVNAAGYTSSYQTPIFFWNSPGVNVQINLGASGNSAGNLTYYVRDQGSVVIDQWSSGVNIITSPGWYHAVITLEKTGNSCTSSFYINGTLVRSNTRTSTSAYLSSASLERSVGSAGSQGEPFKGSIDELGIWGRALSANEISTLYNTGYLSSAVTELALGYTTDQMNELAYLYGDPMHTPVTIGNTEWNYLSGTLPGDTGYSIGQGYEYGGKYYIKLGSGLEGEPLGGTVPEPATVVSMLSGLLLLTFRRVLRMGEPRKMKKGIRS
jgi:hypothetical protein